jgi:hypothetical protein
MRRPTDDITGTTTRKPNPKMNMSPLIGDTPTSEHEGSQGQDGRDPKPDEHPLVLVAGKPKAHREEERGAGRHPDRQLYGLDAFHNLS